MIQFTSIHTIYDCTYYFYYLNHSQYNDQSLRFSFQFFTARTETLV